MQQRFYFVVGVTALASLWFVYDLGYRGLVLAAYRNRLFQLRFELFRMAMIGRLSFDDELYRSLEILLNGLVRYAHLVSYTGYKLTVQEAASWEPDHEFAEMMQGIGVMPPEVNTALLNLLHDTHYALATYMACTSPIFLFLAAKTTMRSLIERSPEQPRHTRYVKVFETEAYRAERLRNLRLAHAT